MTSERRLRLLRNTINTNITTFKLESVINSIEESIHKASMLEGKTSCTTEAFALNKESAATILKNYKLEGLTIEANKFNFNRNEFSIGVFKISWDFLPQ